MHSDGYWVFTRMKDLLLNASIGRQFKGGNQSIANAAPTSDEAPFLDLWESYKSVLTLPAKCQLRLDPDDVGLVEKWYATDAETDGWQGAKLGEFWDDLLGQPFEGVGWYRMTVQVPAGATGKRLHLVFAAVDEEAWVWVNGEPAGEHAEGPEGWNKRFMIEVTEQIRPGQNNVITVRVNNTTAAGGIWKPVRLIAEK